MNSILVETIHFEATSDALLKIIHLYHFDVISYSPIIIINLHFLKSITTYKNIQIKMLQKKQKIFLCTLIKQFKSVRSPGFVKFLHINIYTY